MALKEKTPLRKLYYFMVPLNKDQNRWQQFRDFLCSPIHGNSISEARLLDEVGKALKLQGENAEVSLCQTLFPLEKQVSPKVKNRLRRRLSKLLGHYFDFESLLKYQEDQAMQKRYLIQVANQRKWDPYFPWLYETKAQKVIEGLPQDDSYFMHQMDLAYQLEQFQYRQAKDTNTQTDRYQKELNALHSMFITYQLKLAANITNQSKLAMVDEDIELPFVHSVLDFMKENWESTAPIAQVYLHILLGLQDIESVQIFQKLKQLTFSHAMALGMAEAKAILQHCTNCCMYRYNHFKANGDSQKSKFFQKELLELYDFQLKNGLLFSIETGNPQLDHSEFKNIVVLFSQMGEFTWVAQFIQEYNPKIKKELQQVALHFAKGILEYYQGHFQKAENEIFMVRQILKDSYDRYYSLSAKGYYLRILFERGKYDDCEREARNIGNSIRRNHNLSNQSKQKFLMLCNYLQRISKNVDKPTDSKTKALLALQRKIQEGPPTVSKQWLLQKISDEVHT